MSAGDGWLSALGYELSWLSGYARMRADSRAGAGVILRFSRVRPKRRDAFQPLRSHEITPRRLHQIIGRLKRWNVDIVGMDEALRRAAEPETRRFVVLSFDGLTCDFVDYAWPLLSAHRVPFTVYLAGAFADGRGEIWWLALERVIAAHKRISLMVDHRQLHLQTATTGDKIRAWYYLEGWLRTLPPAALGAAIRDLCLRYSVDIAAVSREAALSWDQVAQFADDPLATVGCSAVDYVRLGNLDDGTAQRQIAMGRAVAQSALPGPVDHFAYPFGDAASYDRRHAAMAAAAGFRSGAGARRGVIGANGRCDPHDLPRVDWDSRHSLRALRVMLWGGVAP